MKKIYIVIILILISFQSFAQTNEKNHEKYWYYRYRMKHYFSTQGEGVYQSLVSARRNSWNWEEIYYGDQTLDMGWYMGVLAIEFHLLSYSSNPDEVNETLTELYYIMKAFERLDRNEGKPPFANADEERDGFFLRKDAEMFEGLNEQTTIDKLNYKLSENETYGTKPPGHPTYVSDMAHGDGGGIHLFQMSQDHVIHLMLGFAHVKRAFKDHSGIITFKNTVTGNNEDFNFYAQALQNVDLIVQYTRNHGHEHGAWRWNIYTPYGSSVHRGADARLYSYGFAKAAGEITGGNYHNSISNLNQPTWQGFQAYNSDESNTNMELILATIGKSWYPKATDWYLEKKSRYIRQGIYMENLNWDYFYIPFYRYFHEKNSPYQRTTEIVNELNSAPTCGPYQYNKDVDNIYYDYCECVIPSHSGSGWAHHNRFRRNESEANGEHEEVGNFPGIDYMILFNLHRVLEGGVSYRNMLNTKLHQNYPYQQNGTWFGTESNPAQLRAFDTFDCDNIIEPSSNGDGSLTLIASNSIRLKPGFHAKSGTYFSAKAEDYDCWAAGNSNKSESDFQDNGYIYNYHPEPMEVIEDENEIHEFNPNLALSIDNEIVFDNTVLIYPNPATDHIQVQLSKDYSSFYQLRILDLYGNLVLELSKYKSGESINISNLSNGIYIAEVLINNQVYQEKFVVL